jgi:hypothetical protein
VVHCGKHSLLIGGCRLNGLRATNSPFCRHPPILASQEQLAALRGLVIIYIVMGVGQSVDGLLGVRQILPQVRRNTATGRVLTDLFVKKNNSYY